MRTIALASLTVASAALLGLAGCSATASAPKPVGFERGSLIGVALPDKGTENGVLTGALFAADLTKAGFTPDVTYAPSSNTASEQARQISTMNSRGAKVLIINAVDGTKLGSQLKDAHHRGAKVIAYDSAIENSSAVDYYLGVSDEKVGELQGQALLDGMAARFPGNTTDNIELFSGASTDPDSAEFFDGAMKILQPKIDDGAVKVVSGQTAIDQTQTTEWLAADAQTRMDTLLATHYSGSTVLNGVLAPDDTLARAIITSIKAAGRNTPTMPVVTGQGSEPASIPLIMTGEQYSTINEDTAKLVARAVAMVKQLAAGNKASTNSPATDNGSVAVPTYYLAPQLVTAKNASAAYADDPTLEALTK